MPSSLLHLASKGWIDNMPPPPGIVGCTPEVGGHVCGPALLPQHGGDVCVLVQLLVISPV